MRKERFAFVLYVLIGAAVTWAQSNTNAAPAIFNGTANIPPLKSSTAWLDASVINSSDICLAIQGAIAVAPATNGIVIDARNYPTGGALTCSVNPFAVSSFANPILLVVGGDSSTSMPGSKGGVVLLP